MSGVVASRRIPSEQLLAKIDDAYRIIEGALDEHFEHHSLTAMCVLFSGGNDSTVLAHLFRDIANCAVHANTTIGIEETRQFVRETCARWDLPLMERTAPKSFRDLVVEQGFPGPAMHFKMYQRLKERCLEQVRRELVKKPRRERVIFLAGRRRAESSRRREIPESERRGSTVWVSPIANWTDEDMAEYRDIFGVPLNPVSEKLGMSGECLCGAFAQAGEYDDIAREYPETAAYISEIQDDVRAAGIEGPKCRWGWGAYRDDPGAQSEQDVRTGPLCSSCEWRRDSELGLDAMFRKVDLPEELSA